MRLEFDNFSRRSRDLGDLSRALEFFEAARPRDRERGRDFTLERDRDPLRRPDLDLERGFFRLSLLLLLPCRSLKGERRFLSPPLLALLSAVDFFLRRILLDRLLECFFRVRSLERDRDDLIFFLIFSDSGSDFFLPGGTVVAAFFFFSSLFGDLGSRLAVATPRPSFFFFLDRDRADELLLLLLLLELLLELRELELPEELDRLGVADLPRPFLFLRPLLGDPERSGDADGLRLFLSFFFVATSRPKSSFVLSLSSTSSSSLSLLSAFLTLSFLPFFSLLASRTRRTS